jgi:hypothetical protein
MKVEHKQEFLGRNNSPTFPIQAYSKQLGCHGYHGTNNPNPEFSKTHLTNMNLNNFKAIGSRELKIIASRSTCTVLAPYQI